MQTRMKSSAVEEIKKPKTPLVETPMTTSILILPLKF